MTLLDFSGLDLLLISSSLPHTVHSITKCLFELHCVMEIQQVHFALMLNTQSLDVISQECSVSLGIHVSHHAAGMSFRSMTPQLGTRACQISFPDESPAQSASLHTFPALHLSTTIVDPTAVFLQTSASVTTSG